MPILDRSKATALLPWNLPHAMSTEQWLDALEECVVPDPEWSPGIALLAAERARQVAIEGYTAEHDRGHEIQLLAAARRYVSDGDAQLRGMRVTPGQPLMEDVRGYIIRDWPWADRFYKPGPDAVRTLVKAGALIAAAIDSLITESRKKERKAN